MGVPVIAGDFGGVYTYPSVPPLFASFQMVSGSVKTFIHGRALMLYGQAGTSGGPIVAASLVSAKTLVENRPVLLSGAVTSLGTGWFGGILQGAGAVGVLLN